MTNRDTALKLQALIDSELSPREAARISRLLDQDPEAQRLYQELHGTHVMLRHCEPEHALPETREFFWSRIRRQIDRGQPAWTMPWETWWGRWLRWMVPVGAAAIVGLVVLHRTVMTPESEPVLLATDHEVETMLTDTTSFSFRSESAGMTVVWVQSSRQNYLGSVD